MGFTDWIARKAQRPPLPRSPELIEIEPTLGCNLRCIMCHVPTMKEKAQFLDIDALTNATKDLTDLPVIIGSEYEPTIHPEFERLLRLSIDRGWKLDFLTNATNLDRYDPEIIRAVRFNVFNVSFDGFRPSTFENIRRSARYDLVMDNALRAAEIARSSGAYTAVNATVLRSNLNETSDLIRYWDAQGFDLVRLLVVQIRAPEEHLFAESLFPIIDELECELNAVAEMVSDLELRIGVRCGYFGTSAFKPPAGVAVREATISSQNPDHRHVPGARQDVQSGQWPGMNWPCRSPFVYARIRWDGAVDLCNKRHVAIGNIYEHSLSEIWSGHLAEVQRRAIIEDTSICETCDYFRFCINVRHLDMADPQSHFAAGTFTNPKTVEWLRNQVGVDSRR
jgi:radical SAM protein with 4Fe4S-binding SPASM domain